MKFQKKFFYKRTNLSTCINNPTVISASPKLTIMTDAKSYDWAKKHNDKADTGE